MPRQCATSHSASTRGVSTPAAASRRSASASASARGHCSERAPPVVGRERLGELVELALEDPVELVHGQLDAVVGDPVLGEVVGADLLRALARADLRAPRRVELGPLALELALVEPRAQDAHRLLAVLQLRLLVLHRDDDARSAGA